VDAATLRNRRGRDHGGARQAFRAVHVPAAAAAGRRPRPRGLKDRPRPPTACRPRRQGLRASHGLAAPVAANSRTTLAARRDGADPPRPAGWPRRRLPACPGWEAWHRPARAAAPAQERRRRAGPGPYREPGRRRRGLQAVGVRSAWIVVTALCAGRDRTQGTARGALGGRTPTPADSGPRERAPGRSTAGHQHGRGLRGAWAGLGRRGPPARAWSQGDQRRFGAGTQRAREGGLVALARQRLRALGRSVGRGELPAGAAATAGRRRVDATARRRAQAAAALVAGVRAGREPRRSRGEDDGGVAATAAGAKPAWSGRAAVVPPGEPVQAPCVRWVGSGLGRAGRSTRTR
jgi:hypothetical protein